ncbi:MAG: hypothetical protein H7Y12_08635 [Sphingobacteriaceae bacterium]|nr:hypothetical protein [Cytophagaceae bacterium]
MKTRIRLDVLFLTALLTLRVLIVPAIFVDYQVRKAYIAKYLCENRNRPELRCDGQCYLAKRLHAAQGQEQSQKGHELMRFLFELPFESPATEFVFTSISLTQRVLLPAYAPLVPAEGAASIFHPPCRG